MTQFMQQLNFWFYRLFILIDVLMGRLAISVMGNHPLFLDYDDALQLIAYFDEVEPHAGIHN